MSAESCLLIFTTKVQHYRILQSRRETGPSRQGKYSQVLQFSSPSTTGRGRKGMTAEAWICGFAAFGDCIRREECLTRDDEIVPLGAIVNGLIPA